MTPVDVGTIRSQGFHDARDPMLYQFNLDIQYQATGSLLLEASYSGALGHDLSSLFVNENQIPFAKALQGLNKQANRPFSYINGTVIPTFSNATNDYNAVNFRVEKRYSKGLALLVNYTVQKNLESGGAGPDAYTQNGGTSIAMDTYNIARERSVAPIDVPQMFTASVGYELPFGPGKPWLSHGGVAAKIAGGWQVNTIGTLRGGFPTDIRTNVLPPIFNTFNVPDRVAGQPLVVNNWSVDSYFNPAASPAVRVRRTRMSPSSRISISRNGICCSSGRSFSISPIHRPSSSRPRAARRSPASARPAAPAMPLTHRSAN